MHATLPSKNGDSNLHRLVKLYQLLGIQNIFDIDFALENSFRSKQLLHIHYHQICQRM